jgi:hypothetical protein
MSLRAAWRIAVISLLASVIASCTGGELEGKPAPEPEPAKKAPDVIPADAYDLSPPLRDIQGGETDHDLFYENERPHPIAHSPMFFSTRFDPAVQTTIGTTAIAATQANFAGIGNGFSGPAGTFQVQSAPPDTDGDVGPNHYMQIVNSDIAIFNKSGTPVFGPKPTSTLWSGFNGACANTNDGDGTIRYDRIADRWVVMQFSVNGGNGPFFQCVAVSQTSDPTGAYWRYQFSYSAFNDYPKTALWPDAYYVTFNMFPNNSFAGAKACAMDRAKMLTGAAATMQCFDTGSNWGGLLASDLDGPTAPPAGSPNYLVALDTAALGFWKFHVDWNTPANSTFTGPTTIPIAAYTALCNGGTCVKQSGTTNTLDSLADRLMNRLVYRNIGGHESLLVNHSVAAGSTGGVRWYELRNPSSPSIFQQGTYAPSDSLYRWMGSIAMDGSGDIALGFSASGSSQKTSIRYTARVPGDAAGTMGQGEGTIIAGNGAQTGTLTRWGDYSSMNIDPTDDCTFWYTDEYLASDGSFNWNTRVASFKLPSCGGQPTNDFSISVSPTSQTVAAGSSVSYTVSTAVTSGSAQNVTLSVSGLPSNVTATFNPPTVSAGQNSTMTLTAAANASAGTSNLTITGAAASGTHTASASVTVTTTANDFSISVAPASQTVAAGSSTTFSVTTKVVSGNAQTITLSAAGVPTGATVTFNPTSVTTGGTSTMTVAVAASAPASSSTITVTGAAGATSHSAPAGLVITTSSGGALVNGGFEQDLTGWTPSGTVSISTTAHSGAKSVMVGSANPTNDNVVSQTFTVPATGGTLSFWYQVHCPDTITYDWATATLTDNVTNTAVIVLAKTCSNSNIWQQASADVSASKGHSVTLTLITHDDDFAGDGSYTLYDDVTVGAAPPPPPNPIQNPGFENGSLSGWTASGTTSVTGSAHSGMFAAQLGGTAPTNGDSKIVQTFTIPAGATSISFSHFIHCPDTLTYDWATVTLKDNTKNTTTTLLVKTCTNGSGWSSVNKSVTANAGDSVTLTVVSHDDNFAGDATYTWFDDFLVQ